MYMHIFVSLLYIFINELMMSHCKSSKKNIFVLSKTLNECFQHSFILGSLKRLTLKNVQLGFLFDTCVSTPVFGPLLASSSPRAIVFQY